MTKVRTRYGSTVVYDPGDNDSGVIMKYQGRTNIDRGMYYAPYVPLTIVGITLEVIEDVGDTWVKIVNWYHLDEIRTWMQEVGMHAIIEMESHIIRFESSEDLTGFLLRWKQ